MSFTEKPLNALVSLNIELPPCTVFTRFGATNSSAESLSGPRPRFGNLFLPLLRRRRRLEQGQKLARDPGDLINGCKEHGLVHLRRRVEAADFPHELQRGRMDLCLANRRFEVK